MKFRLLVESLNKQLSPEGYLYLTGRMIREGWGNGVFYNYNQLKKTVDPVDRWAGKPITIEHEGLSVNSKNYGKVSVGTIIRAFAHDSLKEILCEFVLTNSEAIELCLNGKLYLSIGYDGYHVAKSSFGIDPNHLSLVESPAIKEARILSKQKNIMEEYMNEDELKALAQEIKALQDRVDNDLNEEELAKLMSLVQEMYDVGKPKDDETLCDSSEKDVKITELEAKIAELEAEKAKNACELSKTKKTLSILSMNMNKAKVNGTLASSGNKSFTMSFKK